MLPLSEATTEVTTTDVSPVVFVTQLRYAWNLDAYIRVRLLETIVIKVSWWRPTIIVCWKLTNWSIYSKMYPSFATHVRSWHRFWHLLSRDFGIAVVFMCVMYSSVFYYAAYFIYLWSPCVIGQTIIFTSCGFFFLMAALCSRCGHYVLSCFFFFPRLISAVADWMSTILWHMVWS